MRRISLASATAMGGLLASCSTSPGTPALPPYVAPPLSVVVADPGPVKIRREAFVMDGVVAPPNPNGNAATPSEQNRFRVVRYRVDADPPRPARAVVVMMPGFLGGAGSLDGLARAVVRRSTDTDAFEAWAIDRRSNLLEDTHGLDVAESRKDVAFAQKYYLDGAAVEGKTFEGFLNGAQAPWASEWGLPVTLGDLRKAIELVPQADRAQRVVLLGHSLGGALAEEYAAWDFAGVPGTKELAGLVLVDGVTGGEGKPAPYDQAGYENGGPATDGAFGPRPGVVKDIRAGNTFVALPFLGVKAYMVSEYVAMQARWAPDAVSVDDGRDTLLGILLGQTPMPKLTNRAAFGFAFDEKSCGLQIAAIDCGEGLGGPVTEYDSALGGKLSHPSDPNATYAWLDYDKTNPPENTSIDDAARAWYEGPQLNFAEWYFPQRLTIDPNVALSLDIADDDWRSKAYGLVAKHGKEIDVPVLAVGSVVAKKGAYENLRAFVAPVGAGRPSAGKDRNDPDAFLTIDAPSLTHIDWVVGRDVKGSAVGTFYDALGAFLVKQTTPGGVVIPVRK
jgi:pimeloyl-ACP methyl ester carboxylesterase